MLLTKNGTEKKRWQLYDIKLYIDETKYPVGTETGQLCGVVYSKNWHRKKDWEWTCFVRANVS